MVCHDIHQPVKIALQGQDICTIISQLSAGQIDNTALLNDLDKAYRETIPLLLQLIGAYIREHSAEFIASEVE